MVLIILKFSYYLQHIIDDDHENLADMVLSIPLDLIQGVLM